MSPIQRRLKKEGNALMLVLGFAAIMGVVSPIILSYLKGGQQAVIFSREEMTKQLIQKQLQSHAASRASLLASYRRQAHANVTGGNNLLACLAGSRFDGSDFMIGQVYGSPSDQVTTSNWSSDYTYAVNASGNLLIVPGSGESAVDTQNTTHGEFCISRTTPGAFEVWHPFSMVHPTTGEVIAGSTAAHGSDPISLVTPAAGPSRPARYSASGELCSTTADDRLCPFEAYAFFHPVCPGDYWQGIAPGDVAEHRMDESGWAQAEPPVELKERAGDDAKVSVWSYKKFDIEEVFNAESIGRGLERFNPVRDAAALPPSCGPWPTCGPGFPTFDCHAEPGCEFCPNRSDMCYVESSGASLQRGCYGINESCTYTATGTGWITGTGSGSGTGTGSQTNTGSGTGSSSNTSTSLLISTCNRAASIVVWTRVAWNSTTSWSTSVRIAGNKVLDSRFNSSGAPRSPSELKQIRVCNGIFAATQTATGTATGTAVGEPPFGCP